MKTATFQRISCLVVAATVLCAAGTGSALAAGTPSSPVASASAGARASSLPAVTSVSRVHTSRPAEGLAELPHGNELVFGTTVGMRAHVKVAGVTTSNVDAVGTALEEHFGAIANQAALGGKARRYDTALSDARPRIAMPGYYDPVHNPSQPVRVTATPKWLFGRPTGTFKLRVGGMVHEPDREAFKTLPSYKKFQKERLPEGAVAWWDTAEGRADLASPAGKAATAKSAAAIAKEQATSRAVTARVRRALSEAAQKQPE